MEIDNNIQKKLDKRMIQPSTSAWERLSHKLDIDKKQKRRRKFFYISSAASILLLISVFLLWTKNETLEAPITTEEIIVEAPLDNETFKTKLDDLIKKDEIILVDSKTSKKGTPSIEVRRNENSKRKEKSIPIIKPEIAAKEVVAQNNPSPIKSAKTIPNEIVKRKKKHSRIAVDSEALLYSVTHTEAEVVAYYRKYKIDRNDVLNSIKKELKKSNLKINANSILAEVERDIDDASFKKNFMSIIKRRVSDIATAIASRND